MLLGRDRERLALRRLLADARVGKSGVLALVGEAGIGKTALLDAPASSPTECRFSARAESSPRQPCRSPGCWSCSAPRLGHSNACRSPGRRPPERARAAAGRRADRFAVGAATLSLLAAYAEEAPVLALVDDAHWLDSPSAEALLFAIRRLLADPVAVVLTVRDGHPSLLDGADLPLQRVAVSIARSRLSCSTREAGQRSPAMSPIGSTRPRAATRWRCSRSRRKRRASPPPRRGPVPVSRRITEAFLHRSAPLPERTRRALVLAAASDRGELNVLPRAAASIGLELADLTPGEAAGLVPLRDGVAEFRHPLARAAIYNDASPEERRQVHRALAGALPDRDADRRAWHLASAATGPDEPACSAALQQAAERARHRGAYATSAAAFERAARLAGTRLCDQLLYAAADAAWLGRHR